MVDCGGEIKQIFTSMRQSMLLNSLILCTCTAKVIKVVVWGSKLHSVHSKIVRVMPQGLKERELLD